jgi:hypothetical protein
LLTSRGLLKRDLENQIRGLLKNLGLVIGRAKMNVFAVRADGAYPVFGAAAVHLERNAVRSEAKQGAKEVLMNRNRHMGITLVALYAIIAGLGEIIVGLTGNFLGILSTPLTPSVTTGVVGGFYSLGGISILTMRKWGAALGIAFVAAEILGRAYLVASGIAPASGIDAIKIVIGGIIALGVIAYVWSQWRKFR